MTRDMMKLCTSATRDTVAKAVSDIFGDTSRLILDYYYDNMYADWKHEHKRKYIGVFYELGVKTIALAEVLDSEVINRYRDIQDLTTDRLTTDYGDMNENCWSNLGTPCTCYIKYIQRASNRRHTMMRGIWSVQFDERCLTLDDLRTKEHWGKGALEDIHNLWD